MIAPISYMVKSKLCFNHMHIFMSQQNAASIIAEHKTVKEYFS